MPHQMPDGSVAASAAPEVISSVPTAGGDTADQLLLSGAPGALPHTCQGCGEAFPSRNKLFRHISEHGCAGGTRRRVDRFLLLYGYVGTHLHGSQQNAAADEDRCPTAEGALVAAVRAAALEREGVSGASVEISSRASRTDRGVHALANAVCLRLVTEFHPGTAGPDGGGSSLDARRVEEVACADGPDEEEVRWLAEVQRQMSPDLEVVRRFRLQDPGFNARNECQKREYWYYVPYHVLAAAEGETGLAEVQEAGVDGDEACWIWLTGLPVDCTAVDVSGLIEQQLGAAVTRGAEMRVQVGEAGTAKVRFGDVATSTAACAALDGAAGPPDKEGARWPLLALPEQLARRWRSLNARLRKVLQGLTGCRSFHNFSAGFEGAADPSSVRTVLRCRAGITAGYHEFQVGCPSVVLRITGRSFLYHQIRGMVGLAVAVVSGMVPEAYLGFALSEQCNVKVPLAPAGNLVLAECAFRDDDFAAPWAARARGATFARAGRRGLPGASSASACSGLRAAVVKEINSDASRASFVAFMRELEELAPGMRTALLAWQRQAEVEGC